MATTVTEFFNLASKLFSAEYKGEPEKLQSVIDALNLINENAGAYGTQAVAYIKTKLVGTARQHVENAGTVREIINALRDNIKIEDSATITAKIINIKQKSKPLENYVAELENLICKLNQAYVTEGEPAATAQKYVTSATVRSVAQNAANDRIRVIIEAGTFNSPQAVLAKLATIKTDNPDNNSIFQLRTNYQNQRNPNNFGNPRFGNRFNNQFGYRGNFNRNFNPRSNFGNNYRHNFNYNGRPAYQNNYNNSRYTANNSSNNSRQNSGSSQNNGNTNRNNQSNNRNNRSANANVRAFSTDSENPQVPQEPEDWGYDQEEN